MALTIHSRELDGVTVLDLSGRITLGEGSVQLRDAVKDLVGALWKSACCNNLGAFCGGAGRNEAVRGVWARHTQ